MMLFASAYGLPDFTEILKIFGLMKTICDQWGFTPWLEAAFLIGVLFTFVNRFQGNKD